MTDILRYTPTWVWALLSALIALGVAQLRRRQVARAQLLALPFAMLGLGLWGLATSFSSQPFAFLAWGAALAVATALGRRLPIPAGARWDAASARLHLPGSALPLMLIVAIFALRYTATVALLLHPAWRDAATVLLPLAAVYGAIAGLLLGRALALVGLTRPQGATIAGHASVSAL